MALESAVAAAVGHAISHGISHGSQSGTRARQSEAKPSAARCEVCGNDYQAPIEVNAHGQKGVFD